MLFDEVELSSEFGELRVDVCELVGIVLGVLSMLGVGVVVVCELFACGAVFVFLVVDLTPDGVYLVLAYVEDVCLGGVELAVVFVEFLCVGGLLVDDGVLFVVEVFCECGYPVVVPVDSNSVVVD